MLQLLLQCQKVCLHAGIEAITQCLIRIWYSTQRTWRCSHGSVWGRLWRRNGHGSTDQQRYFSQQVISWQGAFAMLLTRSLSRLQSPDDDPVFLLRLFYQRFFPYKQYFHWLNYGTGKLSSLQDFLWRINMSTCRDLPKLHPPRIQFHIAIWYLHPIQLIPGYRHDEERNWTPSTSENRYWGCVLGQGK